MPTSSSSRPTRRTINAPLCSREEGQPFVFLGSTSEVARAFAYCDMLDMLDMLSGIFPAQCSLGHVRDLALERYRTLSIRSYPRTGPRGAQDSCSGRTFNSVSNASATYCVVQAPPPSTSSRSSGGKPFDFTHHGSPSFLLRSCSLLTLSELFC